MMDGKSDTDRVVHPGCLQAVGSILCGPDW
jgi:hypothetical protein